MHHKPYKNTQYTITITIPNPQSTTHNIYMHIYTTHKPYIIHHTSYTIQHKSYSNNIHHASYTNYTLQQIFLGEMPQLVEVMQDVEPQCQGLQYEVILHSMCMSQTGTHNTFLYAQTV